MQSEELKQMWPSPETTIEDALSRFAFLANKSSLHPLDWGRFYQFVVMAHMRHLGWDHIDVQRRLEKHGFPKEKARYLGEAYWHSRCALYVHVHFEHTSHSDWVRNGGTLLT